MTMRLFYHPMCPFAQRILYFINFKSAPVLLTQIDMTNKPQWFIDLNPNQYFPVLQVLKGDKSYLIRDSIFISEFIDGLEGPKLIPTVKGLDDNLVSALVKMNLNDIESLRSLIGGIYYEKTWRPEFINDFAKKVNKIGNLLKDGNFFANGILGINEISYLDVMSLPYLDRILAFKDSGFEIYDNVDLTNIEIWYKKMIQYVFINKSHLDLGSYIKLRNLIQSGKYKGLTLPLNQFLDS